MENMREHVLFMKNQVLFYLFTILERLFMLKTNMY